MSFRALTKNTLSLYLVFSVISTSIVLPVSAEDLPGGKTLSTDDVDSVRKKQNEDIKKENQKSIIQNTEKEKNKSVKNINDNVEKLEVKDTKLPIEKEKIIQENSSTNVQGNIYPWLPSMQNIFRGKVEQKVQDIKPFGYELFNAESSLLATVTDTPIGNDYVIGTGDTLQVNIWGSVNSSIELTVDRDGKVVLPEVGTYSVSGKSLGSLKQLFKQKLSEIFTDVSVDVSLSKIRKIKVYAVGEAKKPGAYDITSLTTLYNVLFMAGGPTSIGSLRNIDIIRNGKVIKKIDLYGFLLKGDKSGDIKLENGDTIYFNIKGKTVGIQGLVTRPAIYELKNEKTLTEILSLAGGLLSTSYLKNVQIKRVQDKELITLNVDITSREKISRIAIKDNDMINIFPILPIDNQTIYVNGHVFRPGTYEYKKNMKLSSIIKSYNDLLPEPYLEYAQIIRLQQPDLKPVNIMFNLGEILEGKSDIDLKPFDTILIFSKWQLTRIPEIYVQGEIFTPGKYTIVKNTKLLDILSIAGGVTKNTYLDRIEIIRKDDSFGNKKSFSINLKEVINGNTKNNIDLKDEDIIIFHSVKDINQDRSVYIGGQVTKPGAYPLGRSMRLKDLLNLSGNFTKAAYNKEAEITRYTVDGSNVTFNTIVVDLQKALKGEPESNILLQDLDRINIKQISNFNQIGVSVVLSGQVKYPGAYSISPNEKLSDVIERAGGFLEDAYLKGTIFYRESVKELQKARLKKLTSDVEEQVLNDEIVQDPERIKYMSPQELAARERRSSFRKQLLDKLKRAEVTGRIVISLSSLDNLKKSDNDIKLISGDVIDIPKKPDFISVQGEVYNQTAIVYKPGQNLNFYLEKAGGPTSEADRNKIYIVKVDGSVISGEGKWFYDIKNEVLDPGDSILVPQIVEKADPLSALQATVDIAYKTATSAGIFLLRN